jgi:penicillin-binding protein 1A
MRAAHQGVPVANLPVPQPGNPVSDFFQSFSRSGSTPTQPLGPAPADQATYAREPSYGAGRYSQPAYPSRNGNARPQPAQTSGRPEADAGLSGGGWLMDRLFGGR